MMFINQGVRRGAAGVGASGLSALSNRQASQQQFYSKRAFQSFSEPTASTRTKRIANPFSLGSPILLVRNLSNSWIRGFRSSGKVLSEQVPQAEAYSAQPQVKKVGFKLSHVIALTILSFGAGAYAVMTIIGNPLLPKLTDAESATAFQAEHEHQVEVEEYINNHPFVKSLRANPAFSESRPHLRLSDAHRTTSLTAGVLSGLGRIVVPPIVFLDEEAKTMVMVCYLGDFVCGYPGYVHGGLLATLLDEGLGRCTFTALPNKVGMTANLDINYRAPTKAGQYIVMKAWVTKAEGRKAWAEGRLETLPKTEGEEPVVLVEGSGLFVEPRKVKLVSLVTGPITA